MRKKRKIVIRLNKIKKATITADLRAEQERMSKLDAWMVLADNSAKNVSAAVTKTIESVFFYKKIEFCVTAVVS